MRKQDKNGIGMKVLHALVEHGWNSDITADCESAAIIERESGVMELIEALRFTRASLQNMCDAFGAIRSGEMAMALKDSRATLKKFEGE